MKDSDIDNLLKQSADAKQEVNPALLDRISKSIGSDLHPVRTLPASRVLTGALALICGVVAIGGALLLGPYGVRKMSALEIGVIFSFLSLSIWLAAALCVAEAIPGSRRPMAPWLLELWGSIGLAAVFGLLFHDYQTELFLSQGVKCLAAGLGYAVPASLATWWVLRREFFVNPAAAGFARGALAGLAGVSMLELHCPNFEVPHLMVWHITVLPLCGAVGTLVGWAISRKGVPPLS